MIQEKTLDSLIKGIKRASEIIVQEKPTAIFWPLCGGAALSDLFNIINPSFDDCREKSFYLPASISRGFYDVAKEWFLNYLKDLNPTSKTKLIFVDEVKSGGCVRSLMELSDKALKEFAEEQVQNLKKMFFENNKNSEIPNALNKLDDNTNGLYSTNLLFLRDLFQKYFNSKKENKNFSNRKEKELIEQEISKKIKELKNKFVKHYSDLVEIKTVALEHENGVHVQHRQAYNDLIKNGRLFPVGVDSIVTMDNIDLTPVRYTRDAKSGKYHPESFQITVTQKYNKFLEEIAQRVGVNISNLSFPVNQNKILNSYKYLNMFYNK